MSSTGAADATGRRADLLEREREVAALDGMLADAGAGTPGLVVVEGPAGIGKSRLIDELRARARERGFQQLVARAGELERGFPFGVVRQLFEPRLASPDERERLLEGAAAPARPVFRSSDTATGGDGRDTSFAALHGLYWLTVDLADERPVLVVVDDLHWCDAPSLRFLAFLARRLEGMRAMIAVGLRSADPGTDPALIGDLVGGFGAVAVRPRPLGSDAVADLIAARLGAAPHSGFTAACRDATGGNPLLLGELLAVLAADGVAPTEADVPAVGAVGPRAVSRTVLPRLRRLPPEAAAVARAVAVLGDAPQLPHVAALAGMDERAAAGAAAALAEAEILRAEPPLGFVHPLLRDAVYRELPPGRRELCHADAARLLADAGAPPEEVATHLLIAPRRGDQRVVDALAAAADSARRKGAPETAATYLARALEEPPTPDRRGALLLAHGLAAASVDAPAAAGSLAAAYRELEDDRLRAQAAAVLAQCLLFTRPPEEGVAVARRAAREVPAEHAELRRGLEAIEIIGAMFGAPRDAGGGPPAPTRSPRGIDGHGGTGTKMRAAATSWDRALTGGSAAECAELAREALDGGGLAAESAFLAAAAVATLILVESDHAFAALDEIEVHGRRNGSHFAVNVAHYWRGRAWLCRGELSDAETSLRTAIEVARLWDGDVSWEVSELTRALVARGDLAGARELLEGAPVLAPYSDPAHSVRRARVELLIAEGRPDEALTAADAYEAHLGRIDNPAFAPWRSLRAEALDGLGRTADAIALVEAELPLARSWGAAGPLGRALRVLGTLERGHGRDHLHEAVSVLAGSTAHLEHARALLALGAALRRGRRPAEAREPLRRALELADRGGAGDVAARARAELHAAGARPRVTALTGPASLTPSERRVAELAAGGRGNKEIAQMLYVTLKTVEVHLSHAYRKLGISSRRELERALSG